MTRPSHAWVDEDIVEEEGVPAVWARRIVRCSRCNLSILVWHQKQINELRWSYPEPCQGRRGWWDRRWVWFDDDFAMRQVRRGTGSEGEPSRASR